MKVKSKVGLKLLGVNLLSLLVALVGLLVLMQYLATKQILRWHRQQVDLVARLVLAEYQGNLDQVVQAASLLADNPIYGELLAVATDRNMFSNSVTVYGFVIAARKPNC